MSGLITGTLLFRDLGEKQKDKQLFLLMGQLWIPASVEIRAEHLIKVVGSEYMVREPEVMTSIGLQILFNGGIDISRETKKKHPSQLVSLLHTSAP